MNAKSCFHRTDCRLCGSQDLSLVFSLASTPPANAFLSAEQCQLKEEYFPLDIYFCKKCSHVQLLDIVDPAILFRNYVYVSGTSPVFVQHFQKYWERVSALYKLNKEDFVFEIGSNDGTLLRFFQKQGQRVLGMDPAISIAADATKNGIPTLGKFFNEEEAIKIAQEYGKARIILANNVFAHIDDLTGVVKGIRTLLKKEGVFVFEVSYLGDVLEKTLFDTIYHEHLCYHSVKPLVSFFEKYGLKLHRAERVDSHGGSLRGYVSLAESDYPIDASVAELIAVEQKQGLHSEQTFKNFAKQIWDVGEKLRALLLSTKKEGKHIAAFGAPAKATTLMHHFKIGADLVDFIVDDSPLKQGLFSPGMHIPVLPSSSIAEKKPDILLLLAWNFADSIIAKNKVFVSGGGKFIVPLPQVEIRTN